MRAGSRWLLVVPCLALGAACATMGSASPATSDACTGGGERPSREGFFHEVLFAAPSPRTPRFDDYTPGSYHVNKWDLAQGLPAHAGLCGVRLKALLVVGPAGGLWTYHVAALIDEGPTVRINSLVMPHARITGKSTGAMSAEQAASLLQAIKEASSIQAGVPSEKDTTRADFSYRLLLATYDQGKAEYSHADFRDFVPDRATKDLLERVNALLHASQTITYFHGQPVQ